MSTREKILDAVFALVYVNGYNGTSMSMILKECGIPIEDIQKFQEQFLKKGRGSIEVSVEVKDVDGVCTMQAVFSWFVQKL